ncbi:hypothetical protein COV12_01560 [Candidatus Woesearchaeota archaeon CG10_big_fil_rev_8_21_14_0_10_32_24]|nr:MAG: hypothetical protein COV12_01560 [Candidatus Woesearchaeota archaeon CG10_big_fil_rev_8_21_14_0_10_32_24]
MILIDASVFLSDLSVKDVHHEKAVKLFEELRNGKYGEYFTSDYIFNEVVGVTFSKVGKERSVEVGDYIKSSMFILNIDQQLLDGAWIFFEKTPFTLNFVDYTSIVACQLLNNPTILTFDKEFLKVKGITIISS